MPTNTLLIENALLPQRTMKLLLESVDCLVHTTGDAKVSTELLRMTPFSLIVVSTLSSNYDPILIAEQAKRLQPSARVLLWGAVARTLHGPAAAFIDGQLTMPCTLAQLKSVIHATSK
ncbi:hypothetical protein [Massilia brevitalea]|uniref:hypothetical protein n=1 Tax=Massilia brevitalea TaxID=442526 RepID=UPI002739843A|nr:hypothetical protein [Massilia brevitalea]